MVPKEFDAEQRRSQILEHATRIFARNGIDGTSMRNIAQACDCNEALLYRHFLNKKELFRSVIEETQNKINQKWRSISDRKLTGYEAIRNVVHSCIENATDDELRLCALLIHSVAAFLKDKSYKELIKSGFSRQFIFFKDLINRGLEDGSIKPDTDPERCAFCLLVRTQATSMIEAITNEEPFQQLDANGLTNVILGCITDRSVDECDPVEDFFLNNILDRPR